MLFGNREEFGIELEPVSPSWDCRYRPEAVAWAGLSIWIAGQNACRHVASGQDRVQDAVYVPLAPIADWFVAHWAALSFEQTIREFARHRTSQEFGQISPHGILRDWLVSRPPLGQDKDSWDDHRYEWWERHFLLSGADGAQLPNLSILRQDELVWVEAGSTELTGDHPPEFLVHDLASVFSWQRLFETVSGFVTYVGTLLGGAALENLFPWCSSLVPLSADRFSPIKSLELFTGRTSDELCSVAGGIAEKNLPGAFSLRDPNDPATSPATQALRDLSIAKSPKESQQLEGLMRELLGQTQGAPAKELASVRSDCIAAASTTACPEEAGYQAAKELRSRCRLNGTPVSDVDDFCRNFGVRVERRPEQFPVDRMVVGSGEDNSAWIAVLNSPRSHTEQGHRFEVARGLGHLCLDAASGGVVGAGSSPYAQEYRRRRSGAFAAELLMPASELAKQAAIRSEDGPDLEAFRNLLMRYGVGKTTAAYQLWNHNLLPSRDSLDSLLEM